MNMRKVKLFIVVACISICNIYMLKAESKSCLSQTQAVEIGFIPRIIATDLQIKHLIATSVNDSILFTLTYSSKEDRFLAFFNPPEGNNLKYINWNGIKKSDTSVCFSIAKNKFKSTLEITMRFSKNENQEDDRNFIFLDLFEPLTHKLLGTPTASLNGKPICDLQTLRLKEPNSLNKPVNINFKRNFNSTDLKINRLTAIINNDQVEFSLSYSSNKDRFLSLFNPPKGDVLMYWDRTGINKNDTVVSFRIPKTLFKPVNNLTMRFSTNNMEETDRNFIFIEMSGDLINQFK
jgi:hypothetical protein